MTLPFPAPPAPAPPRVTEAEGAAYIQEYAEWRSAYHTWQAQTYHHNRWWKQVWRFLRGHTPYQGVGTAYRPRSWR